MFVRFLAGRVLPLSAIPLVLMLICYASPHLAADDFQPRVLVLVMGGLSDYDHVSINYTEVMPLNKAQADLDAIAAKGKWNAINAKGETKPSGGPNPVDSTSISFQAKDIIGYHNGTLPIEPFITALKRFKFIEVDYIPPAGFDFKGLQDYEDDYVKINMSTMGEGAPRYRIEVKDAGFTNLDLPLLQPAQPVETQQSGYSLWQRVLMGFILGLIGALVVYIVTSLIVRRKAA